MRNLSLLLQSVTGIPLIAAEDELAAIIYQVLTESDNDLCTGDIIVIAQKIVSKAEGRIIDLCTIIPSAKAIQLAEETGKDPRLVELILSESNEVIRYKPGVIIVEHHSGIVLANAGIDHSNVGSAAGQELVTLLPEDANVSARQIREQLQQLSGKQLGVIITDSIGRAWRMGTTGIAIGSSGVLPLRDLRGRQDLFGESLRVTETADIDSLASAACLLMGEADDAVPVVLIRGFKPESTDENANRLIRPRHEDLFR